MIKKFKGPTSKKDKFNDNLLFSCCCARVDLSWFFSTVCKCYQHSWSCDDTCVSEALIEDSLFYSVGVVSNRDALSFSQIFKYYLVTGHRQ